MQRICDQCFSRHDTNACPACGCIDYATYLPSEQDIKVMTLEIQATWTEDEYIKRAHGSCVVSVKPLQAQQDAFRYGRVTRLTIRDQ